MRQSPNDWIPRLLILGGFIATIPFAGVQAGDEEKDLAMFEMMTEKGYRCLECHDVEVKVVGPSWKEVSAKRKDDTWATALISYKLSEGSAGEYGDKGASVGQYGAVEMPHHEVSDEDAEKIARWILGLDESKLRVAVEKK